MDNIDQFKPGSPVSVWCDGCYYAVARVEKIQGEYFSIGDERRYRLDNGRHDQRDSSRKVKPITEETYVAEVERLAIASSLKGVSYENMTLVTLRRLMEITDKADSFSYQETYGRDNS